MLETAQQKFKHPYTRARVRVAMLLLFNTGMRIGNLLHINVGMMKRFLENNVVDIPTIKYSKQKTQTYYIPRTLISYYERLQSEIDALIQNKDLLDPLFTTSNLKIIDRANFTKEVNLLMKIVGDRRGIHIKTHSFRIHLANVALQEEGIFAAKEMLGHSSTKTTETYLRAKLKKEDAIKISNALALREATLKREVTKAKRIHFRPRRGALKQAKLALQAKLENDK